MTDDLKQCREAFVRIEASNEVQAREIAHEIIRHGITNVSIHIPTPQADIQERARELAEELANRMKFASCGHHNTDGDVPTLFDLVDDILLDSMLDSFYQEAETIIAKAILQAKREGMEEAAGICEMSPVFLDIKPEETKKDHGARVANALAAEIRAKMEAL